MNAIDILKSKVKSPYRYFVVYVAKDDGRDGQGSYCKTIEEAEETKSRMEKAWGAQLWDVVIREIKAD